MIGLVIINLFFNKNETQIKIYYYFIEIKIQKLQIKSNFKSSNFNICLSIGLFKIISAPAFLIIS